VDWLEEGWSPLTPSLQVVMWCGLIGREMATTHSVLSGSDVVWTGWKKNDHHSLTPFPQWW
jgi:hypothetical protein